MFKFARLSVLAAVISLPASAAEPVPLAPLSKWNLHYAKNSCQLMREFGDPAKPLGISFERSSLDSGLSLLVFGGPLRAKVSSRTATVAFAPFLAEKDQFGTVAETDGTKETALFWARLSLSSDWEKKRRSIPKASERPVRDLQLDAESLALETAKATQVTKLEITEPSGRKIVLATGRLDKVFAMLRACARQKMAEAGIDLSVQDKIVRPALLITPVASLIKSSDYPKEAFPKGQQSVVKVRLKVGADGIVIDCLTLTPFTAPGFAEVSCDKMRKARFLPAEFGDGTKVPDMVETNIRFVMGT